MSEVLDFIADDHEKTTVVVTNRAVSGLLAMWAVRQSPYLVPDGLAEAITEFMANWPFGDYVEVEWALIWPALKDCIAKSPTIQAWNVPKSGHDSPFVFVSRYDGPSPDDDFIDLDALAMNIEAGLSATI